MQTNFMAKLSGPVQQLVLETEAASLITIEVLLNSELNGRGPFRQGMLKVDIESTQVRLHAPTNGYFESGAVCHEVLHVSRLHVEGVPRLALSEDVAFNSSLDAQLAALDNALEHLVIVPKELQYHPERREHWEADIQRIWSVEFARAGVIRSNIIDAFLSWTFIGHVLPDSPSRPDAISLMEAEGLISEAEYFSSRLIERLTDKVAVIQMLFDSFPVLPRDSSAIEHVNYFTGSQISPIPG